MVPMQIQGTAPQDGSDIKLAQERRMVKTHGLRKVFKGFRLTVMYFFILLIAQSPKERKKHKDSQRFYNVSGPL